jgi:excinuclease ABC subunit C
VADARSGYPRRYGGLGGVVAGLPLEPGIYRFRDEASRVLYIGRATVLRRRVASYWSQLRDRPHLAPMVARIAGIEAVACDSVHEAAWLERNLLEASLPPWNRTAGGQEVPVCIRLDRGPGRPGLSVDHLLPADGGGECFGPYLGGRRVRQAVRGLNRCLPVAYAGTGLRGAATDLARIRGVDQADLAGLTDRLGAVLRREPDAVAWVGGRLAELRDQAAAGLAFELAGAIDGELRALDWVTCPQRATTLERADFTACGWAVGRLTSFAVRGGKITRWARRDCAENEAAPWLAGTPAGWAQFAQRNAVLAAALRGPEPAVPAGAGTDSAGTDSAGTDGAETDSAETDSAGTGGASG